MPFDRPSKHELVSAVREFMEDKLLPELQGHLGFNTRVAINVLKTVERELAQGETTSKETRLRLLQLLKNEDDTLSNRDLNQVLSEEINKRNFSYQDEMLTDHLWKTTMKKLAVDNPRYVSYQQEKDSHYWRNYYELE